MALVVLFGLRGATGIFHFQLAGGGISGGAILGNLMSSYDPRVIRGDTNMIFESRYPSCCVIVYQYQPFQASNTEGLYFAALVQPKSCFFPAISLHFSAYFFGKVGSRVFPILKWVK